MTQTSRPVAAHSSSLPAPAHDPGPYSSLQWRTKEYIQEVGDLYSGSTAAGPYYGYLNNLAITDDGADVTIDTGACLVSGNVLINGASVTISPTHPGAPDEYTVVALLNDAASAYSTSIDVPAAAADYDNLASVPAYSCRLAVFRDSPANLVQGTGVFMVPLATFDIDAAGAITNLTQDTTVRTYVNATTIRTFVPALVGYNNTDALEIVLGGVGVTGTSPRILLTLNKDTSAMGRFVVPNDFISSIVTYSVCAPTPAGNVYVDDTAYIAACTETVSTHTESTGYSQILLAGGGPGTYNCINQHSLTNPALNDIIVLKFTRDGTNVLDTFGSSLVFCGWIVEYLGYRR